MFHLRSAINLLLLFACIGATVWLLHERSDGYNVPQGPSAADLRHLSAQAQEPGKPTTKEVQDKPGANLPEDIDILHQRSLFNEERSEQIEQSDEAEKQEPEKPVDMELIGIGVVGDTAAAVILVPKRRRRGNVDSAGKQGTRHVYRLGQRVEDTGYKITDITLNEVFLSRAGSERVLRLQTSDDASLARKNKAARDDAARQRQRQTTKTAGKTPEGPPHDLPKPESAPGAPPAVRPPEIPDNAPVFPKELIEELERRATKDSSSSGTVSRKERIQKALEARRRIIERRKREADE